MCKEKKDDLLLLSFNGESTAIYMAWPDRPTPESMMKMENDGNHVQLFKVAERSSPVLKILQSPLLKLDF